MFVLFFLLRQILNKTFLRSESYCTFAVALVIHVSYMNKIMLKLTNRSFQYCYFQPT